MRKRTMMDGNQKSICVRVPEDILKATDKMLVNQYRGALNRSAYISMLIRDDLKARKVRI